jgi:putative addiction module component (TIGR02574 family)
MIEMQDENEYSSTVMSTLTKADFLSLSVPERIILVEDIWDSVSEVPDAVILTEEQKAELDRRLDAYHKNPGEGSPWSEVRTRIRSRVCLAS